jgi:DNA-binding beta-propeller fold protein YncE
MRGSRSFLPSILVFLFTTTSAFAYQQVEIIQEIGQFIKKKEARLLNAPRAVAAVGDKFYIADTEANRVVVLDKSGKVVQAWGQKGNKQGQLREPAGIAVDEQGRVYVADTGNDRIQVFAPDGKWVSGFGAGGSGPKEFDGPAGLAAYRGLLYVTDPGNGRVQVFTYDGIYLTQLTVKTKKDEMKEPVDVAVDVQNRVYVLDAGSNAVRIFDPSGSQVGMFGAKGKGSDGFDDPQGLAVDERGNIFVADAGNHKLKKFDPEGKLLGSIGSEGDGPGQFRDAAGVDIDREGRIAVLDSGKHTLQLFSCETGDARPLAPASPPPFVAFSRELPGEVNALALGKRVWGISGDSLFALGVYAGRRIGASGSEPGHLKGPRGLAVDNDGKFWVADTGNSRLQRFSLEGNLLQVIGKSGSGEGEFRSPSGIAVSPKGNIIIADTGNSRVQVLTAKGMFLGVFGKEGKLRGQFGEPVDVATDGSENIYVADRGNHRIAKFDANGTLLWETGRQGKEDGEFNAPENIVVSPDGEVYVLDAGNARIQAFDGNGKFLRKFGSEGKGPGEFLSPRGLMLEDGIRLFVGDRGNKRVQVFTLLHTPMVPKDVAAQPRVNEVQLSWNPNSETYLEQYRIYRSESPSGPFTPVGVSTDPFFMDRNLPSNRTFHYRVSSKAREGNESTLSAVVFAVTPKLVPSSPRKVRIEALEKQITLSWLPNTEPFMKHYVIERTKQLSSEQWEKVATLDKTVHVDGPLADDTFYYYRVTAVGKEGDESQPSEVVFAQTPKASLTVPPLEIGTVALGELFASAYKYYESHALGTVAIRNNTDKAYPRVKVRFSIKDFMDYPTEIEVEEVAANQQVELSLKPVFNNRILEVTENTPLQSEIALTYYIAGEARTVTRTFPVTLYERHAMTWDRKEKVGAFVTAKDPVVADFARLTIQPYVDAWPNLHSSIVYARAIYGALGVLGLTYIVDPTSPFQQSSENAAAVDYLQYPRDTLARKSGDCDDLSILFLACMENIGIGAALVDVPGHVFVMFNTGVPEKEKDTLGFSDQMLAPYQGTMWVPVEMTMVGASFTRAWQKGAEEYREWSARGKAGIVTIQKAWEQFRPVTLPHTDNGLVKVKSEAIEAKFKGELEAMARERLANLSAGYLAILKKKPGDPDALGQLGILYAENGLYAEALEQFQKMLAADKNNAVALNSIGNISFLQGRLEDAKQAYESALAAVPGDAGIMVNLARVLSRMGRTEEAKKLFLEATAIDPRLTKQFQDVGAAVGIGK